MALEGLNKYSCISDSAIDELWKHALTFGRIKGYDKSDRNKIFNKGLGDVEAATSDLETIACVSSTLLHLLKFKKCAVWQTTADVIFTRVDFFGLGLTPQQVLELSEKSVETHFKNFDSDNHCCEYTPKKLPGTVLEKPFD